MNDIRWISLLGLVIFIGYHWIAFYVKAHPSQSRPYLHLGERLALIIACDKDKEIFDAWNKENPLGALTMDDELKYEKLLFNYIGSLTLLWIAYDMPPPPNIYYLLDLIEDWKY